MEDISKHIRGKGVTLNMCNVSLISASLFLSNIMYRIVLFHNHLLLIG